MSQLSSADNLDLTVTGSWGLYAPWQDADTGQTLDISDESGLAASLLWDGGGEVSYELYYSDTELALEVLDVAPVPYAVDLTMVQLGAVKQGKSATFQEYYGGSIGVADFSARLPGARSKQDPAIAFYGGVKSFINKNLAVTLDARMQFVFLDSATTILCAGGCIINIESEVWSHLQLNAGLTIRF